MKKIIFIGLTTFIVTCTLDSYPQGSKVNRNFLLKDFNSALELSGTNAGGPATLISAPEVTAKVIKNFTRDFKKATGVQWIKTSEGLFAAYFNSDDTQNLICYTKNGIFEFQLRYYNEDKLPRDIRALVKSSYYDFEIYLVTEVHRNDKIAYVIKMEDKTSWKTVKVVDGEMEVMEDYTKSK